MTNTIRTHVTLASTPKLIGILVSMGLLTLVFALGTLSESGFLGLMGLLVGYLVGNGVAARAGDPVYPVIGHEPNE